VAVALNVVVSLIAFVAAKSTSYVAPSNEAEATVARSAWPIYLSIALSGLTALACEVIWTRILSLLFGATVYTFSLVLAVFLIGLGIGSTIGSALSHQLKRPRVALAWCQVLLCAAMAWPGSMLMQSRPYWSLDLSTHG